MKLTFLGADHEVTGSCTLLTACGKNILIDYGMEQGRDIYENQPIPVSGGMIDGILLTHAHIDHSGRIPVLYKQGFTAPVWCTKPTRMLCDIMLRDSGHIQEFEAEWRNRKAKRSGAEPYEPLYTVADAMAVMEQFVGVEYGRIVDICPGIQARFTDAGHLLGSASIEIWVTEEDVTRKLLFSGDIGNLHQPLLRDPQYPNTADYAVMESTYGNRTHGERPDYVGELTQILQTTFDKGGNVVIPSFAVGRTQEMLYFLRQIKEQGLIKGHDGFPVYVDSPLANEATNIFRHTMQECFDEEALALVKAGINPISFEGLTATASAEDSKNINFDNRPKVIISASGMCEAGRIRHHLKHNLWRPESTVLFVGYQSVGTLGRSLVEGAKEVTLFGETISVRAQIRTLAGISGHADVNGLVTWVTHLEPKPKKVFVVHGEDTVTDEFAGLLKARHGLDAYAPFSGTEFDLAQGCFTREGVAQRIAPKPARTGDARQDGSPAWRALWSTLQRLTDIVKKYKGHTNKELARFTAQVQSLCDKWDF